MPWIEANLNYDRTKGGFKPFLQYKAKLESLKRLKGPPFFDITITLPQDYRQSTFRVFTRKAPFFFRQPDKLEQSDEFVLNFDEICCNINDANMELILGDYGSKLKLSSCQKCGLLSQNCWLLVTKEVSIRPYWVAKIISYKPELEYVLATAPDFYPSSQYKEISLTREPHKCTNQDK
jgi:hypothetical protein